MTAKIEQLIDKKDGFEVVRDVIAHILEVEITNQRKLAVEANKENPDQWSFDVRRERSNPIEEFRNLAREDSKNSKPVINVWYDNSAFPRGRGNVVNRQTSSSVFNIDCYGLGISENINGGGHVAGDEEAALNVQFCVKLVRNILMSSYYTYLGLQGFVGRRWVDSISAEQAEFNNNNGLHVRAVRIIFNVDFNEFSPQFEGETLEKAFIKLIRASDNKELSKVHFDYQETEG